MKRITTGLLALAIGVAALVGISPAPTHAAPAPLTCADWAPNGINVLLCNLKLIKPPVAPSNPGNAPDACGEAIFRADGSRWNCSFHDDFNGASLDRTKWLPQTNFATGEGNYVSCHIDDPAVVSVSNGSLKLGLKNMGQNVACPAGITSTYASGQVSTFYRFSQQYGRFEARMKNTATTTAGLQEAFWLWPDVREANANTHLWPISGEIDIVETYSQHPTLAIPFLHYAADLGGPQPGINTAWNCVANRGEWNTYALEWKANRLEVFVNGQSCLVNTSGDPAFKKKYIIAFTQAFGVGANKHTGAAPLPAQTEVDYIRVWS